MLESSYHQIVGKDKALSKIYSKIKKGKSLTDEDIAYVDTEVKRPVAKEEKQALCYFLFDLINKNGFPRKILDECDNQLRLFRFKRIVNTPEIFGEAYKYITDKKEVLEFQIPEDVRQKGENSIIHVPTQELERAEREFRIDDWLEGELSLCFWVIEKYIDVAPKCSFLEFFSVYLKSERFHFILRWLYRELLSKISSASTSAREMWISFDDRFTKNWTSLSSLHRFLSKHPGIEVRDKYDLDILTFLNLKAEEELVEFLRREKVNLESSGLFTAGKEIFKIGPCVVIDTNIILSALAYYPGESSPVKVFRKWIDREIEVITSPQILKEYERKLKEKENAIVRKEIAFDWLNFIKECSKQVIPHDKFDVVRHHPEDNKFFECAIHGKAEYIITGDTHILNVKEYKGVKSVTPSEFLQIVENKGIP